MRRSMRQGYTLVEVLMASLVIGMVASALFSGINFLRKREAVTRNMSSQDRQVASLVENIRSNLNLYQASYVVGAEQERDLIESKLRTDELPIAWSLNTIASAKSCSMCPGRLGYVLHPFNGMPGLFKVTLRITNKELFEGYRDYEFIATFK